MKKIAIAALLSLFPLAVSAETRATETKIVSYWVMADGNVLVYLDPTTFSGTRPACYTHSSRMILPLDSDLRKAQFSALMTAHAQDKKVTIWGNNTCTATGYPESEVISYIGIPPQ